MKEGGVESDYLNMNIPDLLCFWSHLVAPQLIFFHLNSYKILKRTEIEFQY